VCVAYNEVGLAPDKLQGMQISFLTGPVDGLYGDAVEATVVRGGN
jgi:hypothetical protein